MGGPENLPFGRKVEAGCLGPCLYSLFTMVQITQLAKDAIKPGSYFVASQESLDSNSLVALSKLHQVDTEQRKY